ncbi:MAG: FecR domain-containing protein [Tannerella sp.]|nr:FecR domain-containing protein [Tannerella sp.]
MREQILKYFEGQLSSEETEKLFSRIQTDKDLRREFIAFQNLQGLTAWLPAENDPVTSVEKLFQFKEARRTEKSKTVYLRRRILRYAVAVVVSVLSTWTLFYYTTQRDIDKENQPAIAYEEFTAPAGQRALLRLQDGTTVWLNAKTTLRYPNRFSKTERRVELNGEAYFEVKENAKQPFIVSTEQLDIKVTGTTFNVFAYKGSQQFITSLVEGSVLVYPLDNEENAIALRPNEQVELKGNNLVKKTFSSTDIFLWKEGVYAFDNQPFHEIVQKLELYYDVKIIVKIKSLDNYSFSGKFRQRDGIEKVLKKLQKIHPFKYTKDEEQNIITIY